MLLIYILAIVTVSMILAGVYFLFFRKADQAREFVQQILNDDDREEQYKRIQQQHFILKRRRKDQSPFFQRLDMDMERANIMLKPNEYIMLTLAASVVGFVFVYALGKGMLFCLLGAIGGFFMPQLFIKLKIMLRMAKAKAEFADVLDTLVNCFKSGYGFTRAIQVVAENFEDPWSTELGKVATEMNFGSTLEDALMALTKRIPTPDVALFVTAVLIQKETGGNLAQLLSNLSNTIRERYKLLSKVSALSAQGKLSAVIVFLIPFGLAGVFTLMQPEMMRVFFQHPIGIALTVFACFMQLLGGLVLKKIVSLEV